MKSFNCLLIVALSLTMFTCKHDCDPPPPADIDLQIQNILQETQVWCWAAVSQQIIYWKKGNAPSQCELVAAAFNANPFYCCSYPQMCATTGTLQQIQALIAYYGGSVSSLAPPATPTDLYNTLSKRKAIILAIQSSPYSGHVIVLRGMSMKNGNDPILYINDPMSYFTQPMPFSQLLPLWTAAIVVN